MRGLTRALFILLVLVHLGFSREGVTIPTPLTKNLGEYYVSIGVMSISELKSMFPRAYNLLVKYHGSPSKRDTHHLAVSIWKQENGKMVYLSNFTVEAEIRSPIFRATRKPLSKYLHQHGDNYGGWFDMSDKGLYHIGIIIKDGQKTKRVNFDYLIQ